MNRDFLIYGANGYTGELIAKLAKERGLQPVLAGRNATALQALADQLGFSYRVFTLDDPRAVDTGLAGVAAVLHCAGPFAHTSQPMLEACLRNKAHYLDITGEIPVFEALAARDADAKQAGIAVVPGVGFDVVPSDCLAAHLHRRLPGATHLRLAFQAKMGVSRGTAATTIERFGEPNLVRRNGAFVEQPFGALTRQVDFGSGPVATIAIPWGDVSTAYHSTHIPNIEVYLAAPAAVRWAMRLNGALAPLLRSGPMQKLLKQRARAGAAGPSSAERATGRSMFWGEASDGESSVTSRLYTQEGYTLTVETAVAAVQRVLDGSVAVGFHTPSRAFGPDFILQMSAVQRVDL